MKELIKLIREARLIFIEGNGGSSATAEHLSSDLLSKGYRAICLNSNTAIMTMIANDFGYEHTFSKQLEVYATANDLLITISCSGTSPNIKNALKTAKDIDMYIYSFKTFGKTRDYGKLEDDHMQLVHKIKKAL
jgi:D-sedoheptulose 7-phosphate isomerase